MKLTPAKCPSCGANIEVNEDLKNAICQYCGTTILIEEAVQKLKIELSGTVKVDGIVGKNEQLEQAKKHIELEEYVDAENLLRNVIALDKFNTEAYAYLLKTLVKKFESENLNNIPTLDLPDLENFDDKFDENSARYDDLDDIKHNVSRWDDVDEIYNIYERCLKIDKGNLNTFLGEDRKSVMHYYEISNKLKNDEERLRNALKEFDKLREDIRLQTKSEDEQYILNKMYNIIKQDLKIEDKFTFNINNMTFVCVGEYHYGELIMVQRDGSIITTYYANNPRAAEYSVQVFFKSKEKASSVDEMINRINKLVEDIRILKENPKNSVGNDKGFFKKLFKK